MFLFAGAMEGLRNPKAHANLNIDERWAMHHLFVVSSYPRLSLTTWDIHEDQDGDVLWHRSLLLRNDTRLVATPRKGS